ncbi:hypothetical protein SDC9_168779 [bioreactor metagenome]|uniref:Uncharacterized protein n=1 Tax=bioreactor metagenome TaxID=1076179 RepID=A0A645G635_9ZZZZ
MREEVDGIKAQDGSHPKKRTNAQTQVRRNLANDARHGMMRAEFEQNGRNERLRGEQTEPRGGDCLQRVLEKGGERRLRGGGLRIHRQHADGFQQSQIAAVEVAAAAVAGCVAKSHADRAARFITRHLQALGVHGVFLAAVLFTHPFGAVGEVAIDAFPLCDLFNDFKKILRVAERNAIVLYAVLLEFHCKGEGGGE